MIFTSINPYNQKKLAEYEHISSASIKGKIRAGEEAFQNWKHSHLGQRKDLLLALSDQLKENKKGFSELITSEMGKPIVQSEAEIEKCMALCEYLAESLDQQLKPKTIRTEALESYISYEPLGGILAIMPWNFPFWQTFRCLVPAIAAGNVGFLKPASNTMGCGMAMQELFIQAGFPDHVFQTLVVDHEIADTIIKNSFIKAVSVTGSTRAGQAVGELSGKFLKPVVMELGGSDPFIVLNDADLDQAATTAVKARMNNSGQSCIAAKRFIVEEGIYDDFVSKVKDQIKALTIGDPMDRNTDIGPLALEEFTNDVHEQVSESLMHGADLHLGGKIQNYTYLPSLLTGCHPGMPAFDEEVFGPVMAVAKVSSVQEAIEIANQTDFGLGATIFTKDIEKAQEIIPQLECGNVFVNAQVASHPKLPFGGIKESGFGRELGPDALITFCNQKTVYIQGS
jgi:succinate-semialdehyde dehydrogenase/glutarate-semialdehyde dehydrogenase